MEGNWPFLPCFTLYLRAISIYKPPGGLYLERQFNGGFFALRVWGAYIWRGLYMEGLIFGILRYIAKNGGNMLKNLTWLWPYPISTSQGYSENVKYLMIFWATLRSCMFTRNNFFFTLLQTKSKTHLKCTLKTQKT